jgi:hypothetical protein
MTKMVQLTIMVLAVAVAAVVEQVILRLVQLLL